MWQDPYTLIIALSKSGEAEGQLYSDDGTGYGYEGGEYVWRRFSLSLFAKGKGKGKKGGKGRVLRSERHPESKEKEQNGWADKVGHVSVEQVVVLGLEEAPRDVKGPRGEKVEWTWEAGAAAEVSGKGEEERASRLVLKKPGVGIVGDWEIEIS
jgi:alpha 1,3-glucosidase